jgi:hypothetical protein
VPPRFEGAYDLPAALYPSNAGQQAVAVPFSALMTAGSPETWIIPGLVTGVPALLLIVLVLGNVLLGASWVPNVGRLLGPEPYVPDDDDHLWWAAGRPLG